MSIPPVSASTSTTATGQVDDLGFDPEQRAEFDQALERMAANTMQSANGAMRAAMAKMQEEPEPDEDDDEPL